jgi:hypothetical protein
VLLLVGDVGRGAGGHQHGAAGSSTRVSPLLGRPREDHALHVAELVGHGLDRVEVLGERDAFLEALATSS